MVSLLSLFSGKKKARRAPSPPRDAIKSSSSTGALAAAGDGVTRPGRPATRFLSLRHKSTSKPYDLSKRRTSSEVARKRSSRQVPRSQTSDLPRLALGWEVPGNDFAASDSLGLKGVGRLPELSDEEVKILGKQRYLSQEVALGWNLFGKALKDTGVDAPGILLPGRVGYDIRLQNLLIALFLLSIHSEALKSLPSIVRHFEVGSNPTSQSSGGVWLDRLHAALKEVTHPHDLAEPLKYLLRHLNLSLPSSVSTSEPPALLKAGLYVSFLQGERKDGFPLDAYQKLLLPGLEVDSSSLLEQVFEVWSAIAARSESNGMSGGKIAKLLGWWILGPSLSERLTWEELYHQWVTYGRQVEHLFYAWIRNQSLTQQVPTRLLKLVNGYPFGQVTEVADLLPTPPPSSFDRRTLRVVMSATSSSDLPTGPLDLVRIALQASQGTQEGTLPHWEAIAKEHITSTMSDLVAEESLTIFREAATSDQSFSRTPTSDFLPATPTIINPTMYRPFSSVSGKAPPQGPAESARPHSHFDGISYSGEPSSTPPPQNFRATTAGDLKASASFVGDEAWDAFKKSGFGETAEPDLILSPQIPTVSLSPVATQARIGFNGETKPKLRAFDRSAGIQLETEEVLDIDDLFMAFIEEGQLDSSITRAWPSFALVRLRNKIQMSDEKDIEWLLVSAVHRPTPVLDVERTPGLRPTSPAVSTVSKSGSSFNLFRRSSSQGGKAGPRRSLFSSAQRASPKNTPSANDLPTLSEAHLSASIEAVEPTSAISSAPTEYTITEMGEMLVVPSPKPAIVEDTLMEPSLDTQPADWTYRAEGAAHIIFAYEGASPAYIGKVLRIKKSGFGEGGAEKPGNTWREKLLPKLLPPDLLLSPRAVKLQADWAKSVVTAAEPVRPLARKAGSVLDASTANEQIKGYIMDDLIAVNLAQGDAMLCIEIKPKWGFLPSADNVYPPEAVPIKSQISRYRLHRHLRDPQNDANDEYDPLDLFSANKERVQKALDALWGIWMSTEGSKNSFRVYADGRVIRPDNIQAIPTACDEGTWSDRTAPFVTPVLHDTGILAHLKRLQETLDPTDISSLAQHFKDVHLDADLFDPSLIPDMTTDELEAFVEKYITGPGEGFNEGGWTLRERLIAYTLSAIFKDCSIFLRIPLSKKDGSYTLQPGASAKVIDLDLKPISNLRKWYDLDQEIWRHWHSTHLPEDDTSSLIPTIRHMQDTPTRLDTASTTALFLPTPAPSTPPTPTQRWINEEHLRSPTKTEALSLTDALSISPDRRTFGEKDIGEDQELIADGEGASLEDDVAWTPSTHTTEVSKPEEEDANVMESARTDDHPTRPEALEAMDEGGHEQQGLGESAQGRGSPILSRKKRSAAPSPSPQPPVSDLPPDLEDHFVGERLVTAAPALMLGAPIAIASGVEEIDAKEDSNDEVSEEALPTAGSIDDHPKMTEIGESTSSVVDPPKPAELMNRDITIHEEPKPSVDQEEVLQDSQPAAEVLMDETPFATGANTPFDEFSTPMGDISEPILHALVPTQAVPTGDHHPEERTCADGGQNAIKADVPAQYRSSQVEELQVPSPAGILVRVTEPAAFQDWPISDHPLRTVDPVPSHQYAGDQTFGPDETVDVEAQELDEEHSHEQKDTSTLSAQPQPVQPDHNAQEDPESILVLAATQPEADSTPTGTASVVEPQLLLPEVISLEAQPVPHTLDTIEEDGALEDQELLVPETPHEQSATSATVTANPDLAPSHSHASTRVEDATSQDDQSTHAERRASITDGGPSSPVRIQPTGDEDKAGRRSELEHADLVSDASEDAIPEKPTSPADAGEGPGLGHKAIRPAPIQSHDRKTASSAVKGEDEADAVDDQELKESDESGRRPATPFSAESVVTPVPQLSSGPSHQDIQSPSRSAQSSDALIPASPPSRPALPSESAELLKSYEAGVEPELDVVDRTIVPDIGEPVPAAPTPASASSEIKQDGEGKGPIGGTSLHEQITQPDDQSRNQKAKSEAEPEQRSDNQPHGAPTHTISPSETASRSADVNDSDLTEEAAETASTTVPLTHSKLSEDDTAPSGRFEEHQS